MPFWANKSSARRPMPPAMTTCTPCSCSQRGSKPGSCGGGASQGLGQDLPGHGVRFDQGELFTVAEVVRQAARSQRNGNFHNMYSVTKIRSQPHGQPAAKPRPQQGSPRPVCRQRGDWMVWCRRRCGNRLAQRRPRRNRRTQTRRRGIQLVQSNRLKPLQKSLVCPNQRPIPAGPIRSL